MKEGRKGEVEEQKKKNSYYNSATPKSKYFF
jgi:hypothetical protein